MEKTGDGSILIVEDCAGLHELTRAIFEMTGFRCQLALGGAAAFEKARAAQPDLIVIEAASRPASGIELCQRIREDGGLAATPVLVVGAGGKNARGAVEAHRAGADDYLEAPVEPALLSAKVARHVERGAAVKQQKVLEGRLRLESEMFLTLMESVPDAIYFKDTEGRFTRVNRHAPFRGGKAAEEVVGKTDFDFFDEAHARAAYEDEQQIIRTGLPAFDKEEKEVYPDGAATWLSTTKAPVFDAEGRVTGIVGISRDISERKLAEEERERLAAAVRAERASLSAAFEQAPAFIATTRGPGHVFEMANHAYRRLVGGRHLAGRPVREALPELEGQGFFELLDRVYETGEPFVAGEMPVDLRPVDGGGVGRRYVSFVYAPMREADGSVSGILCHGADVTERKRAEEEREKLHREVAHQRRRLDSLIANVPGIVWESWVEPEAGGQRVNLVSGQVEPMLGYSREEWLSVPDFWLKIVHPEDRERAQAEAGVMFGGGEGGISQYRMIKKDGEPLWVETRMRLITEGGRVLGVRGITSDIARRKQAEDERERLIGELREALAEVKALRGILPICMYCKNIRNDENFWERVESYISHHTEARFSHSICPDCYVNVVDPQFGGRKDV